MSISIQSKHLQGTKKHTLNFAKVVGKEFLIQKCSAVKAYLTQLLF